MRLDRRGERLGNALPTGGKGLVHHRDGHWYHYSSRGNTVVLRSVEPDQSTSEIRYDLSDLDHHERLIQALRGAAFYSGWAWEGAMEGRSRLIGWRSPVPQTELRRFYETLRTFSESDVHKTILRSLRRKEARPLIDLFEDSFWHFDQYKNVGEGFHDASSPRKTESAKGFAETLARSLEGRGKMPDRISSSWEGDSGLGFSFVAREVNFLRTSGGALFEDGGSGSTSGTGGVDLLLRADDGGLPIVGEIKAEGDTNAFFALIQGLCYACELVTPAQLERTERHYSDDFPKGHLTASEGPHADIFLICEGPPKLLHETQELADELLSNRSTCLGKHIRKIACLHTPLGGGVDGLRRTFVID